MSSRLTVVVRSAERTTFVFFDSAMRKSSRTSGLGCDDALSPYVTNDLEAMLALLCRELFVYKGVMSEREF